MKTLIPELEVKIKLLICSNYMREVLTITLSKTLSTDK